MMTDRKAKLLVGSHLLHVSLAEARVEIEVVSSARIRTGSPAAGVGWRSLRRAYPLLGVMAADVNLPAGAEAGMASGA
jgi:hypothetical protein